MEVYVLSASMELWSMKLVQRPTKTTCHLSSANSNCSILSFKTNINNTCTLQQLDEHLWEYQQFFLRSPFCKSLACATVKLDRAVTYDLPLALESDESCSRLDRKIHFSYGKFYNKYIRRMLCLLELKIKL